MAGNVPNQDIAQWASALNQQLPQIPASFFYAWIAQEKGANSSQANWFGKNNPMNIMYGDFAKQFGGTNGGMSVGQGATNIADFPSMQAGIQATATLIATSYSNFLQAGAQSIRQGSVQPLIAALAGSPWGTGNIGPVYQTFFGGYAPQSLGAPGIDYASAHIPGTDIPLPFGAGNTLPIIPGGGQFGIGGPDVGTGSGFGGAAGQAGNAVSSAADSLAGVGSFFSLLTVHNLQKVGLMIGVGLVIVVGVAALFRGEMK